MQQHARPPPSSPQQCHIGVSDRCQLPSHLSGRKALMGLLQTILQGTPLGAVLQVPMVVPCSLARSAWGSFTSPTGSWWSHFLGGYLHSTPSTSSASEGVPPKTRRGNPRTPSASIPAECESSFVSFHHKSGSLKQNKEVGA